MPGPVTTINISTESFLLIPCHTDIIVLVQTLLSEDERMFHMRSWDAGLGVPSLYRAFRLSVNLLWELKQLDEQDTVM